MRRNLLFAAIGLTTAALGAIFYIGHHYYDMPTAGLFVAAFGGGAGVLLMRWLRTRR